MNNYSPYLSKTLYIKGRQCHKALWLKKYRPELADEVSAAQQALFDSGSDVGILAQQLFSGGVLVPYEGLSMDEQIEQTVQAIARGEKTLYEASFMHDDIFFKADLMTHTADGWNLYEVKSATGVKEVYYADVALQRYVLSGAGIKVNRAFVVHVNNQYVRQGGIEINRLFSTVDVTDETDPLEAGIAAEVATLRRMLQQDLPSIGIGPHCNDPYACEFSGHCRQHLPTPSVFDFARIGKRAFELYDQGILRLEDAPANALNARQRMQKEAWTKKTDSLHVQNIRQFLSSLNYPLCFMDFETFSAPVPLYDDTRPYCQVPFQYSLHILETEDAPLRQKQFVSDGKHNPQLEFIENLLEALPDTGTVLVWNQDFEKGRLNEIQKTYPAKRQQIQNLLDRIVDLMAPFRSRDYYHWQFQGSYSIKKILPVLAPELSYGDLAIQDGSMAPAQWLKMTRLEDPNERQAIREQLFAYCGLDTFAMVRILEELRKKVPPFNKDHLESPRALQSL